MDKKQIKAVGNDIIPCSNKECPYGTNCYRRTILQEFEQSAEEFSPTEGFRTLCAYYIDNGISDAILNFTNREAAFENLVRELLTHKLMDSEFGSCVICYDDIKKEYCENSECSAFKLRKMLKEK